MNTKTIQEGPYEQQLDDSKYCKDTLDLLTEIRDRQKSLLSKINTLNELPYNNERLKLENEVINAIIKDSTLIEGHKILECTDKLLLLAIRWKIIELLNNNKTVLTSDWEQL